MIAPCTISRKYPIVSSFMARAAPAADPDAYLTIRSDLYYSGDIKIGGRSGVRRLEAHRRRRRPNAAGGEHARADGEVDDGAQEHCAHAAEAIEKDLGDALAKEGDADSEPADQYGGRTEGAPQLPRSSRQPAADSHGAKKTYTRNISKSQMLVGQSLADAACLGQLEHRRARGHILDREPDGLEEGHVRWLAASGRACDDVAQRMDPGPIHLPLALRQQEVAGLDAGGLDIVGHHQVGAGNDTAVDLPAIGVVGAANVEMLAGLQPLSGKDRTRRRGDGGEDLGAVDGLAQAAGRANSDRARQRIPELSDQRVAMRGVPARHAHLAQCADGSDGEHLGQ